ncbi:NADH-quinone oxidoreductase subunit D [bacterium]|nr:NADH-quinone oxidoreductase subunit D [bacterium]
MCENLTYVKVKEKFSDSILDYHRKLGDATITLKTENLVEVCSFLKSDPDLDFNFMMDITAVDYPEREKRFEVVYHLYSLSKNQRIRLKVFESDQNQKISTVSSVWKAANWFEREVWDMYGIKFKDHPNMKRILLYEDFEGFPLRKDYPINKEQPIFNKDYDFSEMLSLGALGELKYNPKDENNNRSFFLHIGPSHPATHGTIHIVAEMDGETIKRAAVDIGYLHRGFEKQVEASTYTQAIPYTDRLNYVSPLINNVGYVMAIEKLFNIEITERCKYIRVIVSEISRITDHLTCIAASAMELGAFTVFFYFVKAREYLYKLQEEFCGARLTTNYTRIGGLFYDLPDNFEADLKKCLDETKIAIEDVDKLLKRNRIFYDRTNEIGIISKEDAIEYAFTGPVLRSTGIDYDVRKMNPYLVYDQFDFDVPLGSKGDNYDRYLVRMEEMRQSIRIIEQAMAKIPDGPVNVDDARVSLPPKEKVYNTMEGMINQFKLIYEGIIPPPGEAYFPVEGANGELGFYVVSNGTPKPYKCKVRPPCFSLMQGFHKMIEGYMMADVIATFGTINLIAGENDR